MQGKQRMPIIVPIQRILTRMDIEQVVSAADSTAFVQGLVEMATSYDKPLEAYLRSVLRVALRYRDERPTWQLLARILALAFETLPVPFNRAWLIYTEPPVLATPSSYAAAAPFEQPLHMLRYQITDLHRMARTGALDSLFGDDGITSPTGQRWFNFDPASFLACAAEGMNAERADTACSWVELATFLRLGQTRSPAEHIDIETTASERR